MKKRIMAALVVIAVGSGSFAGEGFADVFMRQRHRTEAFQVMGRTQPPREFIQVVWLTADKARSDMESQSVIVRLDRGVSYFLDHKRKAFVEMDLGDQRGSGSRPMEERTRDPALQSPPPLRMTISDTGETGRIGGYYCRKYIQRVESPMGPSVSEIWATEDLKLDGELYARFTLSLLAAQSGGREALEANLAETRKIRGVPVLSSTSSKVEGTEVRSRTELLEFRETGAPATLFEIPPDYSRQAVMGPGAESGPGGTRSPRRR